MMSWESSIGQTPPRLPFFLMIVSRAPAAAIALSWSLSSGRFKSLGAEEG